MTHLKLKKGKLAFTALALSALITSCGKKQSISPIESSDTKKASFIQSRSNTQRYAYLEQRDLTDQFLFGMRVTKVDGFFGSALGLHNDPEFVRLSLTRKRDQLLVSNLNGQRLLKFNVARGSRGLEVDFKSSENDFEFHNKILSQDGRRTTGGMAWKTYGSPIVVSVQQDQDTVVADIEYPVSAYGKGEEDSLETRSGTVTLRVFLKRKSSLRKDHPGTTISQARSLNLGYFGGRLSDSMFKPNSKIQKIPYTVGEKITFYLKGFPAKYLDLGKNSVESWNAAFGRKVFEAKVAPENVDVGDPRYHVVKWFEGDETVGWSGVAKMINDPETSNVVAANVYINAKGIDFFKQVHKYSNQVVGSLGNVRLRPVEGETPVISFMAGQGQTFEQMKRNSYYGTLVHEVGHVLGLRHNFKASTDLDSEGRPSSVMDYGTRLESTKRMKNPGKYDVAAIRWGYFGERPSQNLAFCTDEDVWKLWDCHRFDHGNPISFARNAIKNGLEVLASSPVMADRKTLRSFETVTELVYKIGFLHNRQLSGAQKSRAQELVNEFNAIYKAEPNSNLYPSERSKAEQNIQLVKKIVSEKVQKLNRGVRR